MSIAKTFNTLLNYFIFYIILSCNNIAKASECNIIPENVVFNAFNPYDATFESATGSVKVKCTNNALLFPDSISYTVTFSAGSSADQTARLVKNGTEIIAYNLYKDSAYTQILGNGSSGTYTFTMSYNLGALGGSRTDSFIFYAKIPIQPLAKPMIYSDTITAYLTYYD